jgi:hypothetical protein
MTRRAGTLQSCQTSVSDGSGDSHPLQPRTLKSTDGTADCELKLDFSAIRDLLPPCQSKFGLVRQDRENYDCGN